MTNELFSDKKSSTTTGCGLFSAIFRRKKPRRPRKSASTGTLPSHINGNINIIFTTTRKNPATGGRKSKPRRGSFDHGLNNNNAAGAPPLSPQPSPNNRVSFPKSAPNSSSNSNPSSRRNLNIPSPRNDNVCNNGRNKMVPKESLGISGELDSLISEHQKNRGGAHLVRVSSGNVMVHTSLGNLRQQGGTTYTYSKPVNGVNKDLDHYQSPNNNNHSHNHNSRYLNSGMGNIIVSNNNNNKKQHQQHQQKQKQNGGNKPTNGASLCRALSCRMDPEELKIMGNEDYKNGRFAEALALYERAVDMDPTQASYRSNKSAALTALGRLLEAVFECKEAIKIEPHYQRAHHRLANLYLRLGEPEKATYHFRQAGPEADPDEMSKAKVVLGHLRKCYEAKRLKDWHTVLKQSSNAISAGADSAPLVYALQAEACLKLLRHQDAEMAMANDPRFNMEQCTKFFGSAAIASVLVIKAQVDMVIGRFDEAMEAAQEAGRLDPSNREVGIVTRRARAVSSARSHGNDLFKDSRFSEACIAYSQGLEHDPYNSVLLCNRAACRIKLGHLEKAVEDCTAALNVRSSYTKARLRRADCNAKLQKWELALRDYEILLQVSPGDEGVYRAWFEAQLQLKKQRGEDVSNMKFANNGVINIQSNEHFRNLISWPGLSVALFSNTPRDKQTLEFMEELCKRYPTVNFIKVEVEDYKWLVQSEGVSSLPAFKIYRSGSKVKEVPGEDHEALERSIEEFIS